MGKRGFRLWRNTTLAGALAAVAGVVPVAGQETPGGLVVTLGVSTTLRASDNFALSSTPSGTTSLSDTRLSFGLKSETPQQTLNLELDGTLRVIDTPGADPKAGLEAPGGKLSYTRTLADSRLSFDASYSRADLDFLDPLQEEDLTEEDLILASGSLDRYRVGLSLALGLTAPLGFQLDVSRNGRRYADTSDPGLFDSRTDTIGATGVLRFSPVTEGRLSLRQEDYTAQDSDETTRITRGFSFGLVHEMSAITTLEASLGFNQIDESFANPALPDRMTQSATGSFSVTRALPRGSVTAALESGFFSTGRQTTLELGWSHDLPAGGLEISLGATEGDGFEPQAIGSIGYTHELPAGAITASLSRGVSTSTESKVQRTTRANIGYRVAMNDLSGVSFNLGYARITDNAVGGSDTERGNFRAAYTRNVTADWDVSVGYEHRYSNSSTTGPARANELFLTLDRKFTFSR